MPSAGCSTTSWTPLLKVNSALSRSERASLPRMVTITLPASRRTEASSISGGVWSTTMSSVSNVTDRRSAVGARGGLLRHEAREPRPLLQVERVELDEGIRAVHGEVGPRRGRPRAGSRTCRRGCRRRRRSRSRTRRGCPARRRSGCRGSPDFLRSPSRSDAWRSWPTVVVDGRRHLRRHDDREVGRQHPEVLELRPVVLRQEVERRLVELERRLRRRPAARA